MYGVYGSWVYLNTKKNESNDVFGEEFKRLVRVNVARFG